MSEKKPKIEYETDVVQCTVRVRFAFDTGEDSSQLGQLNFPLGTDEKTIQDALKDMYGRIQKSKENQPTDNTDAGKKTLNW